MPGVECTYALHLHTSRAGAVMMWARCARSFEAFDVFEGMPHGYREMAKNSNICTNVPAGKQNYLACSTTVKGLFSIIETVKMKCQFFNSFAREGSLRPLPAQKVACFSLTAQLFTTVLLDSRYSSCCDVGSLASVFHAVWVFGPILVILVGYGLFHL